MIDFELKLPATKKTKDQIARDWMIDKAKRPSSAGAYDKFKKRILEARKKDEALKPRQETTMERINRIKYEMKETDKRPKHMDNKNIKTWEQSIAEKPKKPEGQFEKIVSNLHKKKEPTSPVEIDFSLPPMHTAGPWSNIKNSSLYKLLDNPRVMGVELGHEGIMEALNLLQNSGLLKKGGRVR